MHTLSAAAPDRAPRGAPDKIDARILNALRRDGRISNLKLAEQVHLSPTAVVERVKRLRRDGYILGYQARLNPAKLGMGLAVFVQVLLDRTSADAMERFRAAVQAQPEVLECHLIAGSFDYLLKVRVPEGGDYRDRVAAVVSTLPGVRDTHTYTVMDQVKHGHAV